mgnify:CR=1 FL=1
MLFRSCVYDSTRGFRPKDDASPMAPTWDKEEVTPVIPVVYYGRKDQFIITDTSGETLLAWQEKDVTPWVEVMPGAANRFVVREAK